MQAILTAAERQGIRTVADSWDSDAVVIWSVLWSGRMAPNQAVYQHYRSQGRPVIVAEIGTLDRGRTWKISVNNINSRGYYGHDRELDPSRADRLGLRWPALINRQAHVLVALQHARSLQIEHLGDYAAWVAQMIDRVRACTDRPVIIRPHPRCPVDIDVARWHRVRVQQPRRLANTYDSFDLDLDCHAVINANSGVGIQAGLHAVPVIVDETSLAYPVAISIEQIESPPPIDREQWIIAIAHTEYVLSEIEQGLWLKRLEPAL